MNENNIQIEQQSGIEQQSEAQAKRLLAYYSYLRKSQKMTQSELERITGLSRIAINRCENGKLMPTIRSMNKLLAPLGYQLGIVSLDESDSGDYNEEINERQSEKTSWKSRISLSWQKRKRGSVRKRRQSCSKTNYWIH